MKFDLQQRGQCDVISIDGAVMVNDVAALEGTLQRFLTVGRYRILVDLQHCSYIGSAGLSLLISFANNCRRWRQGDLCLVAPPPYVVSLLRLAGLLSEERSFFRIAATIDEGLQILGDSSGEKLANRSDTATLETGL
ncbi:MAG: STAS domain-containing protein [Caldilineaceae bacterium]|nr:STAS domain-containing protein [Caldilineaceae bacterium]